jgi:hypothetical protein
VAAEQVWRGLWLGGATSHGAAPACPGTERLRRGQDRSAIGQRGCLWRSSGGVHSSILFPKSDGEGCGRESRALRLPSPRWPYAARAPTAGGWRLSPPRTPAASLLGGFMLKRHGGPRLRARRPCSSVPRWPCAARALEAPCLGGSALASPRPGFSSRRLPRPSFLLAPRLGASAARGFLPFSPMALRRRLKFFLCLIQIYFLID